MTIFDRFLSYENHFCIVAQNSNIAIVAVTENMNSAFIVDKIMIRFCKHGVWC